MDKASITSAIQQSGLQRLVPQIDSLILPSIRLNANPSDERAIVPGESKLAGMPDMPPGVPWPELKGTPMEFVAQIQLADVHSLRAAAPLPGTGLLSFFYDSSQQTFGDNPNDRLGFKIFYFEQPSSALKRIDLPDDLPAEGRARVCSVDFSEETTLPLQPNLEITTLAWSDDDQEKYDAALQESTSAQKHPIHRLLGHPDTIQDDMRIECQLAANGVADPGADPKKVAQLTPGSNDWILLLQIDTDESIGMRWANAGMLYFWIRRQDLAQRRFQNAWVVLQSE